MNNEKLSPEVQDFIGKRAYYAKLKLARADRRDVEDALGELNHLQAHLTQEEFSQYTTLIVKMRGQVKGGDADEAAIALAEFFGL